MTLVRGALAKIDRRVFAELDHAVGSQMAKLPVSDATWSTWRRYCDVIGLSMGEGIAALVAHELETLINGEVRSVLAEDAARQAAEHSSRLAARERDLDQKDERLLKREADLAAWHRHLGEQRPPVAQARTVNKIGRNEPCPCGSGFKYKLCHGVGSRRRSSREG